jgi:hypothetical protein
MAIGQMVPAILFLATGVFWTAIVIAGGGILLLWAALTCFLSGILLMSEASHWITRALAGSSVLFGLILTIYQLYLGVGLLGISLTAAIYSTVFFGIFTVVYLYLLYGSTLGWSAERSDRRP